MWINTEHVKNLQRLYALLRTLRYYILLGKRSPLSCLYSHLAITVSILGLAHTHGAEPLPLNRLLTQALQRLGYCVPSGSYAIDVDAGLSCHTQREIVQMVGTMGESDTLSPHRQAWVDDGMVNVYVAAQWSALNEVIYLVGRDIESLLYLGTHGVCGCWAEIDEQFGSLMHVCQFHRATHVVATSKG